MRTFAIVTTAYRLAMEKWRVVLVLYLTMQILAVAVIAPLTSVLINSAVRFSDQSALTDQDIAAFLLSPGGFVVGLLVLSIILATQIAVFAVMAATLRLPTAGAMRTTRAALGLVLRRFRALAEFALRFILRVLGLSLPFLAVAGFVAFRNLTEHDINYYLTFKPPEFLWAVALIGVVLLALAAVLLVKLSDWAVSAHLVLFENCPPSECFSQSQSRMFGDRQGLQGELVVWFLVRLIVSQVILFSVGALFATVPFSPDAGMGRIVFFIFCVTGFWLFATWALGAISLAALAVLLDTRFGPAHIADADAPRVKSGWIWGICAGVAVVSAFSLWISHALLDAVQSEDSVEIIAHRGAAGSRPENTMASIEKALEDRADWVEIDVQESKDGQIVVVHDADFMKLAGNPVKVWDADYSELSQIDIGSWFGPEWSDQRPPLLRDVLEVAKGRGKVLIELKHYGHAVELEQRVIDVVEAMGMVEQVALMSLKYPSVLKAQELRPEWRTGILAASAVGDMTGLQGDFLALRSAIVGPRMIERAHGTGKDIYVWTVNDPLQMSQVISEGVDGIITDEPALVHKVLAARAEMNAAQRMALWVSSELGLTMNTDEYRDENP